MQNSTCPTQIGPYAFESDSGELFAFGHTARLEPKAAQVLAVLVQHRGRVVSRQALFDSVWPGQFVVDQALTRCISQIRSALNDKHPHSYLQTLHKRGYRLIAPDCCTVLPR